MELFDNDYEIDGNMDDHDLMMIHVFGGDHELAYLDAYLSDILSVE